MQCWTRRRSVLWCQAEPSALPCLRPLPFCLAASLLAQTAVPRGFVRGVLVERDDTPSGLFTVTAGNAAQPYRFHFDAKTWVERAEHRVTVPLLRRGEMLEVVSEDVPAGPVRYARTVHVIVPRPLERLVVPGGAQRVSRRPVGWSKPRGILSYSGVVTQLSGDRMVLRTRNDGAKIICLRDDTSYLERGDAVAAEHLRANTIVFVRAGPDVHNDLEAYQVVWGGILQPDSR